jgi:hypothetical protein
MLPSSTSRVNDGRMMGTSASYAPLSRTVRIMVSPSRTAPAVGGFTGGSFEMIAAMTTEVSPPPLWW